MPYDDLADYICSDRSRNNISPPGSPEIQGARVTEVTGACGECQCRVYQVAIIGDIGSGKSTLLARLEEQVLSSIAAEDFSFRFTGMQLAPESVDEWTTIKTADGQSHDMLSLYYANQIKEAPRFQNNMLVKRLDQQLKLDAEVRNACPCANGSGGQCARQYVLRIAERTARCGLVFADVIRANKNITELDYRLFEEMLSVFEQCIRQPDAIVWLHVSPEECSKRMRARARSAENGIPISYLQQVDEFYMVRFVNNPTYADKLISFDNQDGHHMSQAGKDSVSNLIRDITRRSMTAR